MAPFVIFGLPRSRTAWLSRFLTYGDWVCGHEEVRHLRSLEDIQTWLSQPSVGTVETSVAPWWRLLDRIAPGARVAVVRRPVPEVVESLMRLRLPFERAVLGAHMHALDRKLDQIAARVPGAVLVDFHDLDDEQVCARLFEHCLGLSHDHDHWEYWNHQNIQIDMRAMMRHFQAFRPAMEKLEKTATHRNLALLRSDKPIEPDGITFQAESIDAWFKDGAALFREHCACVGESPDEWLDKNWPLMRAIHDVGAMQIMTARSNGRMFGYLMTLIAPSLTREGKWSATNTTFFAADEIPGLGMKLQRAAVSALRARGVEEVFFEAGHRGSGPRLGSLYRRLGAEDHGHMYRLELAGV